MRRRRFMTARAAALLGLLSAAPAAAQLDADLRHIQAAIFSGSTPGAVRWYENPANGGEYVALRAPASVSANVSWTLPSADGGSGTCLSTNGAGTLSWAACSGGGSSFYQTMKDGGSPATQRSALNFASASMTLADDAGNDETDFALTTSPANAATLLGTGRTLTATSPITIAGTTSADLSEDRTIACAACVTTNTTQTITASKRLEAALTMGNETSLRFENNFGTLAAHLRAGTTSQVLELVNNTGTVITSWRPGITQIDIGASGYTTTVTGNLSVTAGHIRPIFHNDTDLGASATRFRDAWLQGTLTVGSAATFDGGIVVNGTSDIDVGASGDFFPPAFTGGDMGCSAGVDRRFGFRRDTNELQFCDNGTLVTFQGN